MVVILAVVAEIPHDAGRIFDSEAGLMKKITHPGRSPKSAAQFEGLKSLYNHQLRPQDRAGATRMLSVLSLRGNLGTKMCL